MTNYFKGVTSCFKLRMGEEERQEKELWDRRRGLWEEIVEGEKGWA